jgi:hypothetical protein
MKKKQLKIIADSKKVVEEDKKALSDYIDKLVSRLDDEIEVVGSVQEELQNEYDEMSEAQQEGDKGTALQEEIEKLGEIVDELTSAKDELNSDDLDDAIEKYDEIVVDV